MKNAVFFDIDGTLWNEHMQIPQSTITAIQALRKNGNYAFICSGRSRANICNRELLGIGFDGVVAACGAHIEYNGKLIYEQLMTAEEVETALSIVKKYNLLDIFEGPKYLYVDDEDFHDDDYVVYLRRELGTAIKCITGTKCIEANKFSVDLKGAPVSIVAAEFEKTFDVISHNDWLLEIMPKGHSKATGIVKICELLNIPQENTYAFGDSANDLEMLNLVAHGVAMGNGTMEAKQAAEYVTTHIMEEGIKNGLMHYGLI